MKKYSLLLCVFSPVLLNHASEAPFATTHSPHPFNSSQPKKLESDASCMKILKHNLLLPCAVFTAKQKNPPQTQVNENLSLKRKPEKPCLCLNSCPKTDTVFSNCLKRAAYYIVPVYPGAVTIDSIEERVEYNSTFFSGCYDPNATEPSLAPYEYLLKIGCFPCCFSFGLVNGTFECSYCLMHGCCELCQNKLDD